MRPRLHPERGARGARRPHRGVEQRSASAAHNACVVVRPLGRERRQVGCYDVRRLGSRPCERWATFDCYGTLIDWNAGIGGELARLFGRERRDELLARYHELEPQVEAERLPPYREVLTRDARPLAQEAGVELPEGEADALAQLAARLAAVPRGAGRARGAARARLAARDPLELRPRADRGLRATRSACRSTCRSSPRRSAPTSRRTAHWDASSRSTTAGRAAPRARRAEPLPRRRARDRARARTVWINRLGEAGEPRPTRELPDLARLPDTLDELVRRRERPGAARLATSTRCSRSAVRPTRAVWGELRLDASRTCATSGTELDLERDAWLVELDGRLAGYAHVRPIAATGALMA